MNYKMFTTSLITVIKDCLIVKWSRIQVAALTACSSASVHIKRQFRQSYGYNTSIRAVKINALKLGYTEKMKTINTITSGIRKKMLVLSG